MEEEILGETKEGVKPEREIKFKYVFPDNYNPAYCNGAFGGISTHGEIVVNFFFERMPVPNSMTNAVGEDGSLKEVTAIEPKDLDNTVLRYIPTGIVLSETSAKSIYEWLGHQIADLERRKTQQNLDLNESV